MHVKDSKCKERIRIVSNIIHKGAICAALCIKAFQRSNN